MSNMTVEEKMIYMRRNQKSTFLGKLTTKFKILASFFQILSQFENILQIRFPPIFEDFLRWVGTVLNLDALSLVKVGCIVETNFYTRLLVMTITPLAISAGIFTFAALKQLCVHGEENKRRVVDRATGLFLVLTYMVFVSVSMTVFFTFGCRTYGDNPERFLFLDQSISCDTPKHYAFQFYALLMIFVYPLGITALYTYLLWSHRGELRASDRDENKNLHKISFLWDDYEPEMWWFEIFECFRRQFLTGLLVFVKQGSASQIVLAMVLAFGSFGVYVRFAPFVKDEDDVIAITAQISLFFSLFASLLIKANIDEEDGYNQFWFGVLMIVLNLIAVSMTFLYYLSVPISKLMKALNKKHVHDGALKGVGEGEIDREGFLEYNERLMKSDEIEAGWEKIKPRHMGKNELSGKEWLRKTNSVCEWRCSSGDGPLNEFRVKFEVEAELKEVSESLFSVSQKDRVGATIQQQRFAEKNVDDYDQVYMAIRMPLIFSNRDFVLERFFDMNRPDGSVMCCSRSVSNDNIKTLKESARDRRVRGTMHLGSYLLKGKIDRVSGKNKVEIIHVVGCDLGGVFALDYLTRRASIQRIKSLVNKYHAKFNVGDYDPGRGSSFFDVFSGFRKKGKDLIEDGIELGEIYPGAMKLKFEEVNPMQKKQKPQAPAPTARGTKPQMLKLPPKQGKQNNDNREQVQEQEDKWVKTVTDEGFPYFYNRDTGETKWEWKDEEEVYTTEDK